MAIDRNSLTVFSRQSDNSKPRLACKSLFGKSDPTETRKMLNATMDREARRLRDGWNFDPSSLTSAENRGSNPRQTVPASPIPAKRYEWELQDSKKVPHFYTRPFRKHHSEKPRRPSRPSPLPLSCRDQNASPSPAPGKRIEPTRPLCTGLNFASPPRITHSNVNTSLARFVTALRVPAPTFDGAALPVTSPLREVTTSPSPAVTSPSVTSSSSSAKDASGQRSVSKRQLFASPEGKEAKKRRNEEKAGGHQMRLTEMLPLRKTRSSSKNLEAISSRTFRSLTPAAQGESSR